MSVIPETKPTRRPVNDAEGQFYDEATDAGWTPIKRGWPDYFMWRGDEIAAVEVKPTPYKNLTRHQQRIANALAAHGIPTYRWDPERGFQKVKGE